MRNRSKLKKQSSGSSLSSHPSMPPVPDEADTPSVLRPELKRTATKEETVQTEHDSRPPSSGSVSKRPWTQYRRIIFILGCVLGIFVAWIFRSPELQLEGILESVDMADFFDDIKSALPSALPIGLVREAREIQEHSRQTAGTGAFSIGEQMFGEGMSAHYPVIMVRHRP